MIYLKKVYKFFLSLLLLVYFYGCFSDACFVKGKYKNLRIIIHFIILYFYMHVFIFVVNVKCIVYIFGFILS